jgi:hypothetical protein
MQILRSIALLAFCASSVSAVETDARAIHPEEVIEEIVVKGVHWCGSWPIQHTRLIGCDYVELDKKDLAIVLDLRPKLFSACLSCQGSRCITNVWPEGQTTQKLLCKTLFWTPTRVARFLNVGEHSSSNFGGDNKERTRSLTVYSSPLRVSFTFTISTKGRVEDIEVDSFEGDITEEELLQLIERGATKTRYEPVVIEDMAYEIVGLKDAFKLDDS